MTAQPNDTQHKILPVKWSPDPSLLGTKHARKATTIKSYVPAAIADRGYLLDAALASALATTEKSCAALELVGEHVGLDTVARQLLRAESVASSRIEGYAISNRRLARAAVSGAHDANAETVLGNVAAVTSAVEFGGGPLPVSRDTFVDLHRRLFDSGSDARIAGVLRKSQNWIGGNASTPAGAEFIPPPPSEVEMLLDDLADFCNRDDLPAVLQAAVAHAQFETIHPFIDGNGRVGRALIPLLLRRRELIGEAVPPISLFLAGRADDYVKGLTNYRVGSADDWFAFFSGIVTQAADSTERLAVAVRELQQSWRDKSGSPRSDSAASKLIAALPTHPVLTLSIAIEITGTSGEACRLALNSLEKSGVLRETTAGRRNRVWESVGLFSLLDEFEQESSSGRIRSVKTRG